MSQVTALPVNSQPPVDWYRRVSTAFNTMLGLLQDVYRRPSTTITGNYALGPTDYAVIIDAADGDATLTLTAPTQGREVVVKRIDASSHAVTITGAIDGDQSKALTAQWASIRLIGGEDAWLVV